MFRTLILVVAAFEYSGEALPCVRLAEARGQVSQEQANFAYRLLELPVEQAEVVAELALAKC